MTDIIGLIADSLTVAKGLNEICKEYDNAVLKKQISDLMLQLAESQFKAAQFMTEYHQLLAEIEGRAESPLKHDGRVYRDGNGAAFCPGCYHTVYKRVPLTSFVSAMSGMHYTCPCSGCGFTVNTGEK